MVEVNIWSLFSLCKFCEDAITSVFYASVRLLVDNGLRHNIVKENTHTLKFGRHVSDTPYPSSVLGCLQVMDAACVFALHV